MDKFYVINDKPEIGFKINNSDVIYKTKETALETLKHVKQVCKRSKLRVYEVQAFGSLMTEGLNFKEVFDEKK